MKYSIIVALFVTLVVSGCGNHDSGGTNHHAPQAALVKNERLTLRSIGTKHPGQRLIAWTDSGDILLLNERLQPIGAGEPHRDPDPAGPKSQAMAEALFASLDDVKLPKRISSQTQFDKLTWPRAFRGHVVEKDGTHLLVVESTRESEVRSYQAAIQCPYGEATGGVVVPFAGVAAASVHGNKLVVWSLASCRAIATHSFGEEERPQLLTTLAGVPPRFVGLLGKTPFIYTPDWTAVSKLWDEMPIGPENVMRPLLELSDFDAFTEKEGMLSLHLSQHRAAALPIVKWCLFCPEYGGRVALVEIVPALAREETVPLLVRAIQEDQNYMVVSRALQSLKQIAWAGNMGSNAPVAREACQRVAQTHWLSGVREQARECISEISKQSDSRTTP